MCPPIEKTNSSNCLANRDYCKYAYNHRYREATLSYTTDRDLAFLLVDAARKLNDVHDARMKPLGLTRSQWRALAYIGRSPGISQTELARSLESSRMAITGLLVRMEDKGLVERRRNPGDLRKKSIYLTDKSRKLTSHMERAASSVLQSLFKGMSGREKAELHEVLRRIMFNATVSDLHET
jgi:DNA-binding MarR family transcriptional regulator